jgi:tRNA G18 (ribose-2'-O)-methylase SpoU
MPATSFQIRVCINPECGLRYPLLKDSQFGERCPICLGQTIPVIEKSLHQESINENDPLPTSTILHGILDNIRSALNVGSILRSADGFEFSHIYLCGITPTPEVAEVRKSAVGAEQFVNWSVYKNAVELTVDLKNRQFKIWALEKTKSSVSIHSAIANTQKPEHLAMVVGNEVTGIDPGILEIADSIVHIPMRGQKRSFNASIAFAVAAQMIRSWR